MKNLLFSIITFSALVPVSFVLSSDYYIEDYLRGYPQRLEEALEISKTGFEGCDQIISDFDEIYWKVKEKFENDNYDGPACFWMGSECIHHNPELNRHSDNLFQGCIDDYRDWEIEMAEKAEKEAEEEAERLAEEARQQEIDSALKNCDLDFFEEMTTSEKMDTFDEREACKKQVESTSETTTQTSNSSDTVIVPNDQIIVAPEPASVPTPVSEQINSNIPDTRQVEQLSATSSGNEIISTTTDDVVIVSQEELDRMVEEKAVEKLEQQKVDTVNEPEEEEKPSVFKRVLNFLFGWLM